MRTGTWMAWANLEPRPPLENLMAEGQPYLFMHPYAPQWAEDFRRIAADLRKAAGALAVRIDHIGSTSVPGLCSKDVVDIQLTVADLEPAEPLNSALAQAGFLPRPKILIDHRPPGASGPDTDWAKRYSRETPPRRSVHLHVRAVGKPNQRYPLLFRDYLRTNGLAAEAYARTKQQLCAALNGNIDAYVEIKDPVCDLIYQAAEAWATVVKWMPGPSDG